MDIERRRRNEKKKPATKITHARLHTRQIYLSQHEFVIQPIFNCQLLILRKKKKQIALASNYVLAFLLNDVLYDYVARAKYTTTNLSL